MYPNRPGISSWLICFFCQKTPKSPLGSRKTLMHLHLLRPSWLVCFVQPRMKRCRPRFVGTVGTIGTYPGRPSPNKQNRGGCIPEKETKMLKLNPKWEVWFGSDAFSVPFWLLFFRFHVNFWEDTGWPTNHKSQHETFLV